MAGTNRNSVGLNPKFVKSIKAAEAGGYKKFKSGREMLADLHKAVEGEQ